MPRLQCLWYENNQNSGSLPHLRAMQKLAWRAAPKFNREDVIQFQRDLKEKIKQEEYRIGEY
jgi:hypothetical protein